jgi:hypothetical protein
LNKASVSDGFFSSANFESLSARIKASSRPELEDVLTTFTAGVVEEESPELAAVAGGFSGEMGLRDWVPMITSIDLLGCGILLTE